MIYKTKDIAFCGYGLGINKRESQDGLVAEKSDRIKESGSGAVCILEWQRKATFSVTPDDSSEWQ